MATVKGKVWRKTGEQFNHLLDLDFGNVPLGTPNTVLGFTADGDLVQSATGAIDPFNLPCGTIINADQLPCTYALEVRTVNDRGAIRVDGATDTVHLGWDGGGVKIGSGVRQTGYQFDHNDQGGFRVMTGAAWGINVIPNDDKVMIGGGTATADGPHIVEFKDRVGFEQGMGYRRDEVSGSTILPIGTVYIGVISIPGSNINIELPPTDPSPAGYPALGVRSGGFVIIKDETLGASPTNSITVLGADIGGGDRDMIEGSSGGIIIEDPGGSVSLITNGENWFLMI
jgi:hypothetical protein